jgi:hypothetical protein
MKMKYIMLVAVAGLIGTSTYAQVLDFQSLEHTDDVFAFAQNPYFEDGFRVSTGTGQFYTFGTLSTSYSGSTALFNGASGGTTQLTVQDGGTFDLLSIDLAPVNGNLTNDVTFTRDGGISQTFSITNLLVAQTFSFDSGFEGASTVFWAQTDSLHQFDNIVVAIPEPTTVSLLGLSALAVVMLKRHRTRTNKKDVIPSESMAEKW